MPADKSEMQFDRMLTHVLKGHKELVPADFSGKVLKQLRQQREREILAKVILQEKLALAACIVFGVIVFVLAAVFSHSIAKIAAEINLANLSCFVRAASAGWQLYAVFAGLFGFALYGLIDFLADES